MVLVIWLNENVHFHARFLAMPKLMQAWFLVIWLNENVHFHVRFLAMPKLMQAWFWSFGLTKTFVRKLRMSISLLMLAGFWYISVS